MSSRNPYDLFEAAGVALPEAIGRKPKREKRLPTPAQRAASGRLEGARRSRSPQRHRVAPPRDLASSVVLAFPLHRNAAELRKMSARVPERYSRELSTSCDREARKLEKRLIYKGISKQSARRCAMDLLHEVYMKRVSEADKE